MPPTWKVKYCNICGETDASKLCTTSNAQRKHDHKNLCKMCRAISRPSGAKDWSNGKVCLFCNTRKPIDKFNSVRSKHCLVCSGGAAKKEARSRYKNGPAGKAAQKRQEQGIAAKARHRRYRLSEKRKFAVANGLTGRSKATCHPNRLSAKGGLCSACLRNENTKILADNYIRQLIRKQYDRAGLKVQKITEDMVQAGRAIIIVRRTIKELRK